MLDLLEHRQGRVQTLSPDSPPHTHSAKQPSQRLLSTKLGTSSITVLSVYQQPQKLYTGREGRILARVFPSRIRLQYARLQFLAVPSRPATPLRMKAPLHSPSIATT